jgi:hypothetical protein
LAEVFGDLPLHSLFGEAFLVRAKESYDVYAEGFAVEGGAFPAEEVGLQKALRREVEHSRIAFPDVRLASIDAGGRKGLFGRPGEISGGRAKLAGYLPAHFHAPFHKVGPPK